jgi:NADH-quinone oxidoreductase subunit L
VGALTAVFAALVAIGQNDIKRILAYSTVSQLGYMMIGLGVGGPAVAMFHLIAHAFFKALLFLGAGSVIHGQDGEQDIRKMGGLRKFMPLTFAVYVVGMMALCGVPLFFSGFWSKDHILHAAWEWPGSRAPFYLGVFGAFLTAFYMTRQLFYVFGGKHPASEHEPHESPPVMTIPLVILAVFAVGFGFVGTPAWPWFQQFLDGQSAVADVAALVSGSTLSVMVASTIVVGLGILLAWRLYARMGGSTAQDPLEAAQPTIFATLAGKFYIDEFYRATFVRLNSFVAAIADWFDRQVWNSLASLLAAAFAWLASLARSCDEQGVNGGFDGACEALRKSGRGTSAMQSGQIQWYLRAAGFSIVILSLILLGGCR